MESPRRSKSSPEFEFWMVPGLEPPNLHTADELFVDGVLLPLHLLSLSSSSAVPPVKSSKPSQLHPLPPNSNSDPKLEVETSGEEPPTVHAPPPPESSICSSSVSPAASSRRWKDIIFRKKDPSDEKGKEIKRIKGKRGNGGNGAATELNINIWPFSRSRSAGAAAAGRPKPAACRKSSSAPCSRSNSGGGTGRRWAASPGRTGGGVHVGRASPVWRRAGKPGTARRPAGLNLNVNGCIGCGNSPQSRTTMASCRGEEDQDGSRVGGSLFRFRALFSKKVY